jgi:hypothetical protein
MIILNSQRKSQMIEKYKTILRISATTVTSRRRPTSTPPRQTLKETPSLHYCKMQNKNTIANETF